MRNLLENILFAFDISSFDLEKVEWAKELEGTLSKAYDAPERRFHNSQHVIRFCNDLAILASLEDEGKVFKDYQKLNFCESDDNALRNSIAAALFHDYFYSLNPESRSEARSAEFAASVIVDFAEKFNFTNLNLHLVVNMILATEYPRDSESLFDLKYEERKLVTLFADCDTFDLTRWSNFRELNESIILEIENEFPFMDRESALEARRLFLQSILEKRNLIISEELYLYNEDALENIKSYLDGEE